MGRTIVIGDVHGCFDELSDLLKLAELRTDDRVIAVGDLIVKGWKNREVLDLFIEDDRFSSVIGNHDRALRQYWRGEPVRLTKEQKVTANQLESERERYSTYLRSLPFTINLGTHLVVHAGVRPGVPLRRQMSSDLTEMRTMGANPSRRKGLPWYDVYRGKRIVLFGHWPAKTPRLAPRAIGLDTGCVYGGRLTGYIIESNQFVSVPARRAYVSRNRR
ncbi:MAG TPA: metallophosphoesterase [Pyrinomonadaceae bacterium]|nr:metallophosphoesterase [Pyrinomonadaceae bacterium]